MALVVIAGQDSAMLLDSDDGHDGMDVMIRILIITNLFLSRVAQSFSCCQ